MPFPQFTFLPGHFASSSWQGQGQGVVSQLNIKSHDLKLTGLLHDVTGVLAGGVRARIGGPLDCDGSMQLDLDLGLPPYGLPPLITPLQSGVAVFGLSPTKGVQVPLIVETLHFAAAVDKEVMWDFTAKMNSLSGLLVYPAL